MLPSNCPGIKYFIEIGAIPVNVSVRARANVTAGLANEVEEVNQYPAVINNATAIGIDLWSLFLRNSIVVMSPKVAMTSLKNISESPLIFSEIWIIFNLKI